MFTVKSFIFFCVILSTSYSRFNVAYHPFKISMSEITIDPKNPIIKINVRLFLDDFEDALQVASGNDRLDIMDASRATYLKEEMGKYIIKHFVISLSGKPIELIPKGFSYDDLVLWFELESTFNAPLQALTIENSLLLELFDTQKNIVHLKGIGKTKSFRFSKKKKIEQVILK
ncbi:MAG: DUF6702 family protein [Bacteroidota bacterium]